jgi:non-ribosomal peptide synthase protein (TIGR01720 family)
VARYRADGQLECLGRTDHQVKIRGFRVELGEVEVVLTEHAAVRDAVAVVRDERLVAYVVGEEEAELAIGDLRSYLQVRVPDYMVPAVFVPLSALPLTPNGKVDRRALPAPDEQRLGPEAAYEAPRTHAEEVLASVWADVLGIEKVGVDDNFFEVGGDSILSIQIVARASQAGLRLTPREIFQHPTVASQAAVARQGRKIEAEQGAVEGPVLLTPIQQWFLELDLPERHHWNHSLLFEVRQELALEHLRAAVGAVLEHHDALRLRLRRSEKDWELENAGVAGEVPVTLVDLSGMDEAKQEAAIERRAAELQRTLDLADGPLVRVALFELGAGRAGRLLIIIHHLVVDGVSWRILLEDLMTAYRQVVTGLPLSLPAKTTSFRYWAERLRAWAQSDDVRAELAYWQGLPWEGVRRLPRDFPAGRNDEGSTRSVRVALGVDETRALLQEAPAAYRTEIMEVLLTALGLALKQQTGMSVVLVDVEGHGREDLFDDVDLSRTVGWFTSLFPVVLDVPEVDDVAASLQLIAEQIRLIPSRGIGWGLLTYCTEDPEVTAPLREFPRAEIVFNYLGQTDQASTGGGVIGPAPESAGPERGHSGARSHAIDINGGIGGGRLELEWSYSEALHERATVERLAEAFIHALREIITRAQTLDEVVHASSDLAQFGWSAEEISEIEAEIFDSES